MKDYEVFVPNRGDAFQRFIAVLTVTARNALHAIQVAKNKGVLAPVVGEKS
jgi:hypothetical protein